MLEIDATGRVGHLDVEARLATPPTGPLVLVGPSGAGKSSLLLMALGFVPLSRGSVRLGGQPLADAAQRINVPPEARALGYVPQQYALFPHMTALQNVRFALPRGQGVANTAHERNERALALLSELDVAHLAHRRPETFSGGESQRVALARALAREPEALLLDEPLAALDAGTRREVRSLLADRLRALRLPAVVVTHDPQDALALGGRLAVMEGGRVVQSGTFDELRASPATRFVAEFTSLETK